MAGNAQPQFIASANIGSALVDAANTNSDGTGNISTPTMYLVLSAGANDTWIDWVRIMVVASTAASVGAATVIRLYISSVSSGTTTNANTWLFDEIAIPSVTADQTTIATNPFDRTYGYRLKTGSFILASTHIVAAANTHNRVTMFGGDY